MVRRNAYLAPTQVLSSAGLHTYCIKPFAKLIFSCVSQTQSLRCYLVVIIIIVILNDFSLMWYFNNALNDIYNVKVL